MGVRNGIGWSGMFFVAFIACAMCVIAYLVKPVEIPSLQMGLCLNSPDSWQIAPLISWILNTSVIATIPILLYLINKSYNFIRTTDIVIMAVFLIMASSNAFFTQGINTSTLLCLVNVASLGFIFSTYESKNATSHLFIIGLMLGVGSMLQYAFLIMTPFFVICALFMKVLRVKEILAYLAGILCPYWITLGLGLVNVSDFHLPSMTSFFRTDNDPADIFFLLVGIGLATFIGFMTTLMNFMKLYAGNSRVTAMNFCVIALGIVLVISILVDYENIMAYVISLYLVTAIQIANMCALWNISQQWLVTVVLSLLFIALFAGSLFL